jgi:D-arabinitol dehydrogenase (NADP+)
MRAVVYQRPGHFEVGDVPDPRPGPGEVLLESVAAGVCGTDLHLLAGEFLARYPLVPGHEIVGRVAAHGAGVTGPPVGELVAADNTVLCGACFFCRRDQPLFCRDFTSLGCNAPGAFAELVAVRAEKCFPLDGLDPMVAVMTEPLACAMHGADVLRLRPGSDVLVFGAGPTGLLLTQLLLHGGAARVTVAAPSEHKLALARRFGADQTVRIARDDPVAGIQELGRLAPYGFDAVVEATGSVAVLQACPGLTMDGGTVLVYGVAREEDRASLSPYEIFSRELRVQGSFAQTHCFDRALLALRTGRVRTDRIVTDRFSLGDHGAALDAVRGSQTVKAVVLPAG